MLLLDPAPTTEDQEPAENGVEIQKDEDPTF